MKGPDEDNDEGEGTKDFKNYELHVYMLINFLGILKRNSIIDNKASRTFSSSNNSLLVFRIMLKEHQTKKK